MIRRRIASTFLALLALVTGSAAAARAQAAPPPSSLRVRVLNMTAAEQAEKGRARRDTAAMPGDVLRYTLVFVNRLPRPVRGVALANPIPAGVQLVAGSTRATRADARVEYSADLGASYSPRPVEQVVEDGRTLRRVIPPERYTHVRWMLDGQVPPSDSVVTEFAVRIRSRSL